MPIPGMVFIPERWTHVQWPADAPAKGLRVSTVHCASARQLLSPFNRFAVSVNYFQYCQEQSVKTRHVMTFLILCVFVVEKYLYFGRSVYIESDDVTKLGENKTKQFFHL
jgi:hypothetical protein